MEKRFWKADLAKSKCQFFPFRGKMYHRLIQCRVPKYSLTNTIKLIWGHQHHLHQQGLPHESISGSLAETKFGKPLWQQSNFLNIIQIDSWRLIFGLEVNTVYDLQEKSLVSLYFQNIYNTRGPQGESVMALLDIFQSVKTWIGWK